MKVGAEFPAGRASRIPAACFVLAGGTGERLRPLTRTAPKPLLPFGAVHRLVDFTLSNIRNSGLPRAYVLSQYLGEDMTRYLRGYRGRTGSDQTVFLNRPPAAGKRYRGTADAVAQNLDCLRPDTDETDAVLVVSADHVYKMDYRGLLGHHARTRAGVTLAAVTVPLGEASGFGVLTADASGRILGFEEKPVTPTPYSDRADRALVSMGVYVFNSWLLGRALAELSARDLGMDFGRHVLPWMVERDLAGVYVPRGTAGPGYWMDVGTLAAYHQSHMDYIDGRLGFDPRDESWPVTSAEDLVVRLPEGVQRSKVARSAVIDPDAALDRTVVGRGVRIEAGAEVRNSVLLPGVRVRRGQSVRNAILAPGETVIVGPAEREWTRAMSVSQRSGTSERGYRGWPTGMGRD